MARGVAQHLGRGLEAHDHHHPVVGLAPDRAPIANSAKFLAAEAGFFSADRAAQTLGGMGCAIEHDVECCFCESRIMRIAPVSQEMTLNFFAQKVLGLPRSY